jgi:hypothetical protein
MSFRIRDTTTTIDDTPQPVVNLTKKSKKHKKKTMKSSKQVQITKKSGGLKMKPDFTGQSDYF